MQSAQNSKEKSTSPNGEEAAKFGFKKKQDEELDEEQQRAEEIEMAEKLRKAIESDQGEKWCEETTEHIELMPSRASVGLREKNGRSPRAMMKIQFESFLENKGWTEQFWTLNGNFGKLKGFRKLVQIQTTGKTLAERLKVETPELFQTYLQLNWNKIGKLHVQRHSHDTH